MHRVFRGFRVLLPCRRTPEEFGAQLRHALAAEPAPMAPEERQRLTWEAATERFLDVAELTERERPRGLPATLEAATYAAINTLSGAGQPKILSLGIMTECEGLLCAGLRAGSPRASPRKRTRQVSVRGFVVGRRALQWVCARYWQML